MSPFCKGETRLQVNMLVNVCTSSVGKHLFRTYCKSRPFRDIPSPGPSIPFFGTSWQYSKLFGKYELNKIHEAIKEKYDQYGPIIKEEVKWRNYIVQIFHPDDFEKVLRCQGKCPHRPPNEFTCYYRNSNPSKYPNVGLSNMLGDEWLKQRQLLAPAILKLDSYKTFMPRLNLINDDFIKHLEEACDEFTIINNLHLITDRLALESMLMLCLDTRLGCLSFNPSDDGQRLLDGIKQLFESFHELYFGSFLWKLFPTKSYKKYTQAEDLIYDTTLKYIERWMLKPQSNQNNEHSLTLLQTLLNTEGLDEKDAITSIIDFIMGGINSISTSLCFLLYHISNSPTAQDVLFTQVKTVVGYKNKPITKEHLNLMPFLHACIKESFRLTSTIPSLIRILLEEIVLSEYTVPAGTPITLNINVSSKLESLFEEPYKFKPERWLGPNRTKIHPFAVLPFGYGVRMCVGRRISELILYLTTVKVILSYELETVTKKLDLAQKFIIVPNHPIQIKLRKRK